MTDWNKVKDNVTVEKAMEMLEETVKEMENPSLTFEETVSLYKRANEIFTFCHNYLSDAKKEVITIDDYIEQMTHNSNVPTEEE